MTRPWIATAHEWLNSGKPVRRLENGRPGVTCHVRDVHGLCRLPYAASQASTSARARYAATAAHDAPKPFTSRA